MRGAIATEREVGMTEDRAYTILTALRNIKLSISDEMNEQLKPWFEDIEKAIEDEQMGIQELSQEPCDDVISREAVLNTEYQVKEINGIEYVMLSEVQMKIRKMPLWLGKNCKDCGNKKCKELGELPKGYDCALWRAESEE